ncbi:MAG TPA: acyl-CoA dehydrogenase family protein [Edaphocola sp.]|nr:acyl-CoA dehydrogenase family protein [Edaphocola sp.]
MEYSKAIKGGEFLIRDSSPEDIFIPEDWDEEQKMIAEMCREFLDKEITPKLVQIDAAEDGLMVRLLDKAAELGLLGVSVPEEYGGLGKDFVTSMLVTERLGAGHSFAVAYAAHTGIGTLPILYYGDEQQKMKYIPKLASGEWKGAYCLTEPEAGSDANSGKTRAALSAGGRFYILNGQKMWITNAGFADVFTVFAKIDDDDDLSAFIVEKSFGGIELGAEEHKMGIKGSSTRQVFFNDCKVPVENLLSERGNGFKIAVNILNLGRIKLGGAALGAAKEVINHAVQYANERVQFGHKIAGYGAIQYKLAEQAIRAFAMESATYRASRDIESATKALIEEGLEAQQAKLRGTEQFAVEAAIVKVLASEALDYIVDEGVQIYGGMGFSAEAPMERSYRDSRINRIFEGTNEINRMLTADMLFKRAMKGQLDLISAAKNVAEELLAIPDYSDQINKTPLAGEQKAVAGFKKAVLLVAGAAVQRLMTKLADEQEILMYLADMLIDVYAAESMCLRVQKILISGKDDLIPEKTAMVQTFVYDAAGRIYTAGRNALNAFEEGDEKRMMLMGLKRFTKVREMNTVKLRRQIAAKLTGENKYCF